MRYTALISLLIILIHTTSIKSEVITTNNLLDKNFDNKSWTLTVESSLDYNVIASEHDNYIQFDDISLKNDAN